MGVAKTTWGLNVDRWIWHNVHHHDRKETLDDMINRLQNESKWLEKINGDKRLTISVIGFQQRRPFAITLSNFQNMEGKHFELTSSLIRFDRRPKASEHLAYCFGDARL